VLAGEIVHHMRSAFDHLIWQLSIQEARDKFAGDIEFPVSEHPPECIWRVSDGKVKHSSYCRKTKGVTSITALTRIDNLQPYKRIDRDNSPILIIHTLDKFDKHRELVDVSAQAAGRGVGRVRRVVNTVKDSASGGMRLIPVGPPKVEVYAELFAEVAFTKLRQWKSQPLIPFLEDLLSFTRDSVESFAGEF